MMGNNSSQLSPSMLASTEGVGNDLSLADMYVMRSTAEATNRAIKNADDGRQQIAISNEMDHAIETDEKSSPQNADIDAQTFEQNALSEKIADCIDNSGIGERSATREDSAIKLGRPTNPSSKKPISVRAAGSTSFSNPSSLNSTSPAVNTNHVTEINEHIHKESTMNQSSLGNHKQCTHSTNKQRSANPTTTIQKRTSTDLYEQIYARGILVHDPKNRVQHQLQAPRQLNQGLQASSQMHHLPPTDIGAPMTAESFYCAKISCYGKEYQLGEYQLYADKIKAQDDAAALVTGPFSFPTFQTPMDYLRARSIEMMQRGISIETSEPCVTVDQRIKYYLQQLSFDLGTSAKEASTGKSTIPSCSIDLRSMAYSLSVMAKLTTQICYRMLLLKRICLKYLRQQMSLLHRNAKVQLPTVVNSALKSQPLPYSQQVKVLLTIKVSNLATPNLWLWFVSKVKTPCLWDVISFKPMPH